MAKFTQMAPAQAGSRDRSNSGGGKKRRRRNRRRNRRSNT